MRHFGKWKKGFTLVEVITVVAIIAVFSTVVTLATSSAIQNSKEKAVKTRLASYWKQAAQYFDQVNLGFIPAEDGGGGDKGGGNAPGISPRHLAYRFGVQDYKIDLSTYSCVDLKEGCIYVRYKYLPEFKYMPYQLDRVMINYEDIYYYTNDGVNLLSDTTLPKD